MSHLVSYLTSGHDPSASGTLTLWIVQFLGLYSPFKAHTCDMDEWPNYLSDISVQLDREAAHSAGFCASSDFFLSGF